MKMQALVTIGSMLLATGAASAASIGVNFVGGRNLAASDTLAAADSAGVVPQSNYNNFTGNLQTTPAALSDNAGSATTATLTFAGTSTFAATANTPAGGTTPSTRDEALNNGGFYSSTLVGGVKTATATVASIPYATYDVYVYTLNDQTTGNFSVTLTPTGGSALPTVFGLNPNPADATHVDGNASTAYVYTPATGTTALNANSSDYVVFSGLTATGFSVGVTNSASNPAIDGIQIVQTPEPASMGLLAVGSLGLLARRRR